MEQGISVVAWSPVRRSLAWCEHESTNLSLPAWVTGRGCGPSGVTSTHMPGEFAEGTGRGAW